MLYWNILYRGGTDDSHFQNKLKAPFETSTKPPLESDDI
jgi:hypothetical protein